MSLLPECLDDYVAEDNPVRVVEAFIDALDLHKLGFASAVPQSTGRPAYHPSAMLKIYVYGYLNRVHSSIKLNCVRASPWDRGHEMADHQRFSLSTDIEVYFCDPHSPWQRGSNENTNGLLRQYFPKGTDLSAHSQAKLSAVARQLNERPRETLEFESPAERFSACVASTG